MTEEDDVSLDVIRKYFCHRSSLPLIMCIATVLSPSAIELPVKKQASIEKHYFCPNVYHNCFISIKSPVVAESDTFHIVVDEIFE